MLPPKYVANLLPRPALIARVGSDDPKARPAHTLLQIVISYRSVAGLSHAVGIPCLGCFSASGQRQTPQGVRPSSCWVLCQMVLRLRSRHSIAGCVAQSPQPACTGRDLARWTDTSGAYPQSLTGGDALLFLMWFLVATGILRKHLQRWCPRLGSWQKLPQRRSAPSKAGNCNMRAPG